MRQIDILSVVTASNALGLAVFGIADGLKGRPWPGEAGFGSIRRHQGPIGVAVGVDWWRGPGRFGYALTLGVVAVAAAAVDDFSLAVPDKYQDVVRRSHSVAVLASRRDIVLKSAYPTGDPVRRLLFFWKEDFGRALGYHGPRPENTHPVPPGMRQERVPDSRQAGQGDYFARSRQANREQQSTVHFVNQVLSENVDPSYPTVTAWWLLRPPSRLGEEFGSVRRRVDGSVRLENTGGRWHD